MRVIVVGMGEVGRHVVEVLQRDGHEVVAIDVSEEVLAAVSERMDIATLCGYGASPAILTEAGVAEADLVVAVTNHDETNLVAALAGRHLGAKRSIARLQGSEFGRATDGVMQGFLGVDVVVNPRVLAAREIARIARSHGALDVVGFASDRVEVVQLEVPPRSRIIGRPLSDLTLPHKTLVAAVVRDGDLFVPGGADVLLAGDRVYLAGLAARMNDAEDLFCGGREASRVCIVGGGVVGEALAKNLVGSPVEVTIIERDAARAEHLAAELRHATVLHGDGTDVALLEEEGAGDHDLFCALTHEDEVNLMSALLAKRLGAMRTISLVHRPDYMPIQRQLGIDVVLSPRILASDRILKYVRRTELESLFSIEDGQAEVLEMVAVPDSRVVGVPLRRLNVPRGAILCAIVSGDEVRIPRGDDRVEAGDTVIVLATAQARRDVERLFQKRAF